MLVTAATPHARNIATKFLCVVASLVMAIMIVMESSVHDYDYRHDFRFVGETETNHLCV